MDLANPDLPWVYFVEFAPFHKPTETVFPIFIATADVFFDANDPDAPNREYNGIVDIALSISRSISLTAAGVSPDAQPDRGGTTVIVDDEFATDTAAGMPKWQECAWDDYPYRVLRGVKPKNGAPWRYAALEVVDLGVTLDGNTWGATMITIPLGGFSARLAKDVATVAYLGTGAFEGGDDIKGKVKNRAYGHCQHVTPVLIDPANEWWDVAPVYGFHSNVKVYQGGKEYEYDVASPPAAGKVYIDMANGRIQTRGWPSYKLSVSFVSDFGGGAVTKAAVIEAIALEAGFEPSEIDAAVFAAFDAADDSVIQAYVEQSTPAIAIVNKLLAPGAFHTENAGKLQIFQFTPPTATTPDEADVFITDADLIPGQLSIKPDIVPASRIDLSYAQCLTTFTLTDLVEEAEEENRLFVLSTWRTEPYENPDTATAHRTAKPAAAESAMINKADAAAEAARLAGMFTVRQETIDTPIAAAPFAFRPHGEVWVQSDFYRINAAFRAISVGSMSRSSRVTTTLWRPRT